jgi:hypothetical protein
MVMDTASLVGSTRELLDFLGTAPREDLQGIYRIPANHLITQEESHCFTELMLAMAVRRGFHAELRKYDESSLSLEIDLVDPSNWCVPTLH